MKQIHYINIGMAKAGTTSIFDTLITHPDIDYTGIKENYSFSHYGVSIDQYKDYYNKFNISLNFCPALWTMETRQIMQLSNIVTHYSIIFRNPYQFIKSLYYFLPTKHNQSIKSFIDMMLETNQLDYSKILTHWEPISQEKPFKVMYYEDLQQGQKFYNSLINFLNIRKISLVPKISNVSNNVNKDKITFSIEHVNVINKLIEKFEQKMNKNFNHWKENV